MTPQHKVERLLIDHGPMVEAMQKHAAVQGILFGVAGLLGLLEPDSDDDRMTQCMAMVLAAWVEYTKERPSPVLLSQDEMIQWVTDHE